MKSSHLLPALALVACCGGVRTARAAEVAAADLEFFEKKVRPVLVVHCSGCHANGKTKGGLDLGSRAGLLRGGSSGAAVVPGHADRGLLLEAVRYGSETRMPPKGKLPDAAVADLAEWVRRGAPWPDTPAAGGAGGLRPPGDAVTAADRAFWSFRPVVDPPPPAVRDAAWVRKPLDRFVLARLEAKGLHPVRPADRRALLRRVTFDLTGLPPTPGEVEAFVADGSPDAYDKVVDRLLASPHYGERWARYWLDVARYGEDQAHTFQARLYPSGYRYRDWVVKAFNDDKPYDRFVLEQLAGDLLADGDPDSRLPALGFVALGPHYYRDAGEAKAAEAAELDDRVDTLTRGFLGLTVACARCHDHKFDPVPQKDYYSLAGVFHSTAYAERPLAPPEAVRRYDEGQARVREKEAKVKALLDAEAARLAAGRAGEVARYALAAWKLHARRAAKPGLAAAEVARADGLQEATLERWEKYLFERKAADRPHLAGWRAALSGLDAGKDLSADTAAVAKVTAAAAALQEQVWAYQRERDGLAKLPEAERKKKADPARDKARAECLKDFTSPEGVFKLDAKQVEAALPADEKGRLAGLRAEAEAAKKGAPPRPPFAHALAEAAAADMKVYLRGDPKKEGEVAPRRFLRVLAGDDPPHFTRGSGRLELARVIADPKNPLTARVMVNRIWQHHFGKGIVATPSNFGSLGARPTHPELLDHLAARFVASGWSVKALHREVLLSATYQLSCDPDTDALRADPGNQLLWRMNRQRLDVEAWRDALLAASGELDPAVGGPPAGLASPDNRRRTLYGAVSRHDLDGLLRLFDFPDPNLTSESRPVTVVPLQGLFVLNSPFMAARARALARHLAAADGDDAARIRRAFLRLYARPAAEDEVRLGLDFLAAPEPAGTPRPLLTRWEQYAQVLLAANEFAFVD